MSGYFSKIRKKFLSEPNKGGVVKDSYGTSEQGANSSYNSGSELEESVMKMVEDLNIPKDKVDAVIKKAAQHGYDSCVEKLKKGERYTIIPAGDGTKEKVDNYEFAKGMADRLGLGYEELDKLIKPEAIKKEGVKKDAEYKNNS